MNAVAPHRVLMLVGEESGDLHGSHLVRALLASKTSLEVFAFGGERMRQAGAQLIVNTLKNSVVGVSEVLKSLPTLMTRAREVKDWIAKHPVDLTILIDFPGFHLRLLPHLASLSKTVYFIPPKVWVWQAKRASQILRYCDRIYTIFPFEKDYFAEKSRYFGHPLVDIVKAPRKRGEFLDSLGLSPSLRYLALVPGSREQEISRMLPLFLEAAERLATRKDLGGFLIPKTSSLDSRCYRVPEKVGGLPLVLHEGDSYSLLNACDLALATSGTVTLEASILETPMIISNQGSWITYLAFKALSRIPFLGLPNILGGKEICPELLQNEASAENLEHFAALYLDSPRILEAQVRELERVNSKLGRPGVFEKIARDIHQEYLK
jgi:lipid-A-disaccharide synthase